MILSYGHFDQNLYLSCQQDLTKLLVPYVHDCYIYKIQHTRHISVVSRMVIEMLEMLEPDSAPAAVGRRGAESE